MAFLTLWLPTLHRLKGVAEMIDAYLSIARLQGRLWKPHYDYGAQLENLKRNIGEVKCIKRWCGWKIIYNAPMSKVE